MPASNDTILPRTDYNNLSVLRGLYSYEDKKYILSINGENESSRISKTDFKDATWAGQVGAGLDLLFLTFDIGYEFGLEDFLTIHSMDDLAFRNHMWYVSLGWRLF